MPLERISKGFVDISMSFQSNPLTRDLLHIKNETAIARSIRNLVLTYPGERFFNPSLGSEVNKSLFENYDKASESVIKDEIRSTIERYEPRVKLQSVNTAFDDNSQELSVTIVYQIIGISVPPQQLSFALQSTR